MGNYEEIGTPNDVHMPDVGIIDVVPTRHLPSGKASLAPCTFYGIAANEYTVLGSALWLDIDALCVDEFIEEYAIDGWLPGDGQSEWTRAWCWRN